jgi:demethylsterigmatocystin 6-O-methyltransferase
VLFSFDTCGPAYQEMPSFLKRHGYKNPSDSYQTVWQDAYNVKENCFEWMMGRPEAFANFNLYMNSRRENQPSWIDVFPVKDDITNLSPERALFVDVGGGIGHQCVEFKRMYPDLPGRVILQDLPFAVQNAISSPGVEAMAHDFTQTQPIKGK